MTRCTRAQRWTHPRINAHGRDAIGSQTGSQRRQIPGYARRQSAAISAAKQHIGPHPAMSGDVPNVPSKQRVAGSNPARRTRQTAGQRSAARELQRRCEGFPWRRASSVPNALPPRRNLWLLASSVRASSPRASAIWRCRSPVACRSRRRLRRRGPTLAPTSGLGGGPGRRASARTTVRW